MAQAGSHAVTERAAKSAGMPTVIAVVMPDTVESAVIDCPSWPNRLMSSTW